MHMHIMIHAIVMSVQPFFKRLPDDSTSVALVMDSCYIVPNVFAVCGMPCSDTYIALERIAAHVSCLET